MPLLWKSSHLGQVSRTRQSKLACSSSSDPPLYRPRKNNSRLGESKWCSHICRSCLGVHARCQHQGGFNESLTLASSVWVVDWFKPAWFHHLAYTDQDPTGLHNIWPNNFDCVVCSIDCATWIFTKPIGTQYRPASRSPSSPLGGKVRGRGGKSIRIKFHVAFAALPYFIQLISEADDGSI